MQNELQFTKSQLRKIVIDARKFAAEKVAEDSFYFKHDEILQKELKDKIQNFFLSNLPNYLLTDRVIDFLIFPICIKPVIVNIDNGSIEIELSLIFDLPSENQTSKERSEILCNFYIDPFNFIHHNINLLIDETNTSSFNHGTDASMKKQVASPGGGNLPSWGWGASKDLTVSDFPINLFNPHCQGYAEETGIIRYNGQKLPFLAQGEAGGVEASFSMQNIYAFKTLDSFTGIDDFKGGTISFNLSLGMIGISIFTDYHGPYKAIGQNYLGIKLGLGYGGLFSVTTTDTRGLYGH